MRSVEGVLQGDELVINHEETVEEIEDSTFILIG